MATGTKEVSPAVRPYEKLMKRAHGKAELESGLGSEVNSFDIASQVVDKIAVATTADDILAANDSSLASGEDFIGLPLNITAIQVRKSDEKYAKESLGVYLVVTATQDNGEEVQFTTGATNIVASLEQAESIGVLSEAKPFRCKIVAKETARGQLLRLARA